MVAEAAQHESEDKLKREQIERKNTLDNLCYQLEKQLSEHKDKLPAGDVSEIEALVKEGREAVESQDDAKITSVTERLQASAHKMAEAAYKAAGADGAKPEEGGAKKDPSVVDAEFEEAN